MLQLMKALSTISDDVGYFVGFSQLEVEVCDMIWQQDLLIKKLSETKLEESLLKIFRKY